ncbi:2-amino-4-hydroxy-6-hydroxymethyldihydropteridine diphosphokinase [Martelella sp. HB161492]|uniref:2-amino-4-hydroxy-6- hydroxymethyldihydropteridine diphosphokinase n=1 Tax=Martelella sp. HB161492 TaxID=2720726 RepID=UPI0015909E38|nr:2-amino-4-hydroxy-6-hydroxymethyldihydropteridine diphosphokinase [Martelella sp. HB161492]
MSDWINIKNLCVYGFHGVLPEETRLGQRFYIDLDCALDMTDCAANDEYEKSVCYGALSRRAIEIASGAPFKLIETLASRIADAALQEFPRLERVVVRVRKPSAPVAADFDHVGVSVDRRRQYRVAMSLGTNIGDKAVNLKTALAHLATEDDFEITAVSRFYRTAPWGNEDQDWFLNTCAIARTTRAPLDLLKAFKRIELRMERVPAERWGPRLIDIDLLYANDRVINSPQLSLPHPQMFERAFVLVPLAEIAGDDVVLGRKIDDAVAALDIAADDVYPADEPR